MKHLELLDFINNNNRGLMGAKKKRQCKKKKSNQFIMIGSSRCYYKGKTQANFQPVSQVSTLPKFNFDNLYYTPSFVIPMIYGEKKEQEYLASLEEKARNNEEISASKILVPKPRSKSKYCSMCHSYYDDYLSHIHLDRHKQQFKKSEFQQYILGFCSRYPELSPDQTPSDEGKLDKEDVNNLDKEDVNNLDVNNLEKEDVNKSDTFATHDNIRV